MEHDKEGYYFLIAGLRMQFPLISPLNHHIHCEAFCKFGSLIIGLIGSMFQILGFEWLLEATCCLLALLTTHPHGASHDTHI